jgi:hypothetical protein
MSVGCTGVAKTHATECSARRQGVNGLRRSFVANSGENEPKPDAGDDARGPIGQLPGSYRAEGSVP